MKIFLDANICLDFLDSSRLNSKDSISWYMKNKDNQDLEFYFSGNFITTLYYILTQKRKLDSNLVIEAISSLCSEITPLYLEHSDFLLAKDSFEKCILKDFEDLIILQSAKRNYCNIFITNDKELIGLKNFEDIKIQNLEEK